MPDTTTLITLTLVFLVISYLSASVGLGGGSTYTAVMAASGVGIYAIPLVSLSLNLVVTSAGCLQYIRHRHASWKLIWPFLVSSVPMAYLGGSLQLPKTLFYGILFGSLVIVVIRIFCYQQTSIKLKLSRWKSLAVCLGIGALLGFIAGVVGIGGGIYLVPIIIILGLGSEKEAAASGSIFIWINSMSGLIARFQHYPINIQPYLPLLVSVLIGGMLGATMGATKLKPQTMQKILGCIIIAALCLLSHKLIFSI
ncbi:MAG: sulfite exporter TauE/SafE family protein [Akkermansiaceae bacterium]